MAYQKLFLLFAAVLPAASLHIPTPHGNSMKLEREAEKAELMFIHDPKVTLLRDITEEATQKSVPRGWTRDNGTIPVTPVKMSLYPPLVIMTGVDRLSQGIQEVSRTHIEGDYEHEFVDLILDQFKDHGSKGNLLDVGANMGAFTLPFAQATQLTGVTISVEALQLNRNLLRTSIKANELNNVHLYEYAVGNTTWDDSVRFDGGGPNSGHAAFMPNKGAFTLQATTLDSILKVDPAMKKVFAMKMDIEGTESSALDGGKNFLQNYPPCIILVEMNRGPIHNQNLEDHITQWGYERSFGKEGPQFRRPGFSAHQFKNMQYQQKDMESCMARIKHCDEVGAVNC